MTDTNGSTRAASRRRKPPTPSFLPTPSEESAQSLTKREFIAAIVLSGFAQANMASILNQSDFEYSPKLVATALVYADQLLEQAKKA